MNKIEAYKEALARAMGALEGYQAEGAIQHFYQDRPDKDVEKIAQAFQQIIARLAEQSQRRGTSNKPPRTLRGPHPRKKVIQRSFEGLNAEEIAAQVERSIKSTARKWKAEHQNSRANPKEAATAVVVAYLQEHKQLFERENNIQETKDMYQYWLDLMREWFISTVERRGGRNA